MFFKITGGAVMELATTKGKEFALEQLRLRRQENAGRKKVDNSSLPAEAPMYYYCTSCNHEMKLPENHTCPAPDLCDECKAMKMLGWLE